MDTFEHITNYLEQAFTEQPVWREHALIRKLQQDKIEPITSLSLSNMLELFKVHFLVRHGIYQLREKWRGAKHADLAIGTIEIIAIPYPTICASHTETDTTIREADLLELYYKDLSNYANMTEAEVELLLKGFWQRLQNPEDSQEALETLGLKKGASYQEIKSAFRRHAQKSHPDKGGDEVAFQSLTKARDTLLAQATKN
jgi:DnaJ-domain-containing protein 1